MVIIFILILVSIASITILITMITRTIVSTTLCLRTPKKDTNPHMTLRLRNVSYFIFWGRGVLTQIEPCFSFHDNSYDHCSFCSYLNIRIAFAGATREQKSCKPSSSYAKKNRQPKRTWAGFRFQGFRRFRFRVSCTLLSSSPPLLFWGLV